jgi:CBS domain containing-hemolysin-like protein
MQLAFFLIPKSEIVWLPENSTLRQAMERMERHGYTAVPVLDGEGKYAFTITAADLLWEIKNTPDFTFADSEQIRLRDIKRAKEVQAVNIGEKMSRLLLRATEQNFIPVVDDYGTFIGIVRRREIMEYCMGLFDEDESEE